MSVTVAHSRFRVRHRQALSRIAGALVLAGAVATLGGGVADASKPNDPPEPGETEKPPDRGAAAEPKSGAATQPTVKLDAEPAPLVKRLLEDDLTAKAEKRRLRVFHGQWDPLNVDVLSLKRRAKLALLQYDLDHESLAQAETPPRLKARAALRRGEPKRALTLLEGADTIQARYLKARAHHLLGQSDQAVAMLLPVRKKLLAHKIESAPALTAAARSAALLPRLQERPAADYHLIMRLLGRVHQTVDPLYWPALLAEAELLLQKDNRKQAMKALKQALKLNPKTSQGWFMLGKVAAEHFNFDKAEKAAARLEKINPDHPLATRLKARIALKQRQPEPARQAIKPLLKRWPTQRHALALKAAVEGLAYDKPAMKAVFSRFEKLSPGAALAHTVAGQFLSTARQYEVAESVLRTAVKRAPNWPRPRIKLGLLLMQMGKLEPAESVLSRATELDPFQRRAQNQLELARSLLDYKTVETEHFIIRYKAGVDRVLAKDMPTQLERMYDEVTSVFQHEPKGKTQIDLMPDEQHFAVRITGMPDIWTIAASTGPVIALTPPRAGRNQRGAFDWANVVRHEFVHTVTLDRTANRLPHWFTEGAAVSQELTGRSYDDCQLLTWAVRNDELFRLDEINWGFIRPESKRDRPLAYAQAHWFIEYLTTQHGHAAVLKLMRLYNDGVGNVAAMEKVTGRPADAFFNRFKAWARAQVRQWGLARTLGQKTALNLLAQQRGAQSADEVVRLWAITGRDPDALKQKAKQRMARLDAAPRGGPPGRYAPRRGGGDRRSTRGKDASPDQSEPLIDAVAKDNVTGQKRDAYQAARKAVMQYAEARPVDPWTDRALARLALRLGRTPETVGSLKRLDRTATRTGQWAWQLARLHRRGGRMSAASGAIQRALDREPYNASYRALAATLALQQSDHEQALHHLKAMARLEPKEAIHHVRLAALLTRMGQRAEAEKHARQARKLNPDAPVGRFLSNAE